ncbi:MAG: hypothetical protein ACRCTA_02655, partial [Bacilli bacterium]
MNLQTKLNTIKFSQKQNELFSKLGLNTIDDLLSFYPARYQEIKKTPLIDGNVIIEGIIKSQIKNVFFNGRKSRIYFDLLVDDKLVKVSIFNQFYLMSNLNNASEITLIGKYDQKYNSIVASEIKFDKLDHITGIYPIYHLKNLYKNKDFTKLVAKVYAMIKDQINNIIPNDIIIKYQLLDKQQALANIHFPHDSKELKRASNTIKFEELFCFALTNHLQYHLNQNNAHVKEINLEQITTFITTIGYTLTNDQRQVLNEIYKDMSAHK